MTKRQQILESQCWSSRYGLPKIGQEITSVFLLLLVPLSLLLVPVSCETPTCASRKTMTSSKQFTSKTRTEQQLPYKSGGLLCRYSGFKLTLLRPRYLHPLFWDYIALLVIRLFRKFSSWDCCVLVVRVCTVDY